MKPTIAIFIILFSCSHLHNNELESEVLTLNLSYVAWACDCPNWVIEEDLAIYSSDELAKKCIYIEPAFDQLELPDTLGYNNDLIRFKGSFYEHKGYPKNYNSIEMAIKARIFRYTEFEVLRSNFNNSKVGIKSGQ